MRSIQLLHTYPIEVLYYKTKIKWHKLFDSVEDAEEQIKLFELKVWQLGNKKVCLTRTPEGFFGMTDKCPHQGGPLNEGICTAQGTVICPWHQYEFDLKTGRDRTGHHVQLFPVEVRADGVYVGVEKGHWSFFSS